ncbi:nucleotidyltransferase family protein [Maribius pontilimi]|uniref:Nucleotidyltransferase family protein n=2 Tax=Palleronia pontilimi TaxID=1964209 RepID=A0A934I9G1_9RHOB|nr:nucleotidyltransferase family protein [Palleronia pontilimi]
MLFAAGFGTRMGALTADRPKPMVPVSGRPLIDHAVSLAHAAGIRRVVANTHYKAEILAPHLADLGVVESREEPRILDTGGGLKHARPLLGRGPVFTLNSDAVFRGPNPLTTLADHWRDGMAALLLVVPLDRAHGRDAPGDFALTDGTLARGGAMVFTGAQIIDPSILESHADPVFSLSEVWTDLALAGALHGVVHDGDWADVGHPDGIARAEALIADV